MKLRAWGETDVGLKRENNQDTILLSPKLDLYIVADGMGGHRGGEVASALAVKTAQEVLEASVSMAQNFSAGEALARAYSEASLRIYHRSHVENPDLMGMGTTMVAAFRHQNTLYIGNVGDSRAYLYSKRNLWQLTEDHSLINEQIRAGVVNPENAHEFVGRNVITRSVGFEKDVAVDIIQRELQPDDLILMCSDGLTALVSDARIADMCHRTPTEILPSACIEAAKKAGGDDNVSVVVLRYN